MKKNINCFVKGCASVECPPMDPPLNKVFRLNDKFEKLESTEYKIYFKRYLHM